MHTTVQICLLILCVNLCRETEDLPRFAPPPDYFAMYPRELAENGNGPRIYTASLHRDVRQTDFD